MIASLNNILNLYAEVRSGAWIPDGDCPAGGGDDRRSWRSSPQCCAAWLAVPERSIEKEADHD